MEPIPSPAPEEKFMKRILVFQLLLLMLLPISTSVWAQQQTERQYPPQLDSANRVEVYKSVGDTQLRLWVYEPANHRPSERRPAIVFFFGGGWRSGSPRQFEQHCRYFASRGMVAMTADYRVASRHGVPAVECVKDAKSAVSWIREHAAELGIDPARLAAGGGSAGGHIAACTATADKVQPDDATETASSVPDALVLFNPVMRLGEGAEGVVDTGEINQRTGVAPEIISPYHALDKVCPPTIIFFGTDDRLFAGARDFAEKARELGNRCELLTWKDQRHGFFNYRPEQDPKMFIETVEAADRFLTSLGYLEGEPAIEKFAEQLDGQ